MLLTVVGLRLYLHGFQVQHVYPGGYLFHHLFTGVMITVPAAFVLAFGTRFRWLAVVVRLALGVGPGLMLDEIAYLVMTGASDEDYVSWTSLIGAIVLVSIASALAIGLYRWHDAKYRTDLPREANQGEQVGTGQPATRPEPKSEGGDKPQTDAEGRSR